MGDRMLFYISFATDEGFLGAAIVDADRISHAVARAHQLGINPGGEAAVFEWPADEPIDDDMIGRLLSKAEVVERLEGQRLGDLPQDEQDLFDETLNVACEGCNDSMSIVRKEEE